jgi:DivIVA domain-containing protein
MVKELSPIEIERTDFSTSLRGYDRSEVDAHLRMISLHVAEAEADLREHAYAHLGEEMGRLLQHSREAADQMLADASAEAARLKEIAEKEAADLIAAARERVRVLRGSEREARQRMTELSARLGELHMNLAEMGQEPAAGLPATLDGEHVAKVIDLNEAELSS